MSTPKAISYYLELPQKERQRLGQFVRSPIHNTRPKLLHLLEAIEKSVGNESEWNKKRLHAEIFKTDTFNELQINNLLSDLYKVMQKFTAWNSSEKKSDSVELLVLENLIESGSGISKHVIKKNERTNSMKDPHENYQFNLLADRYYFQQTRKTDNTYILKSLDQLNIYYLANQLKIWCELLNRSNVLSLKYDDDQLKLFSETLENLLPAYQNNPYVSLYYPLFQWLKNTDEDRWYEGYMQKLIDNVKDISSADAKEVCDYIQNYCVRRINQGRDEFLRELFNLFSLMLQYNLAYSGQYLNQWTFKNIVTVGVRLKEFIWTENFIHNYYTKLPPLERDNAYQFNLSVFYYESNRYDRAMQLLNKVHFTDPNYYLDAKSILLKIYFEQEEDAAITSLRDTVKIYLLRDKLLSKNQKQLYKNLFAYTSKLFRLKYESAHLPKEKRKAALASLKADLAANQLVANKQWLESQMNIPEADPGLN